MIQLYQTLDLRPIGIPQTLRLSQYDSDFEIIFELTNFDGTWILDTNTTAEVQGTKTDGHGYSADAVFDDQLKTVTIAGDVQMTAAAGRNVFEVVLFHDGDRLGSKNFILDVERAALDAETTASDSKIKNFTEMVEAAEDAAETATAAAEAAEEAAASIVPGLSPEAKTALLNCFAHVAWIDEYGQDYYDALYDALYSTRVLTSISAVFTQGSAVIYADDPLDSLKQYLVVTAVYDDNTTAVIPASDYTLSGTLAQGTCTITVTYGGKMTTFTAIVSAPYWDYTWDASSGELPEYMTADYYDFTTEAGAMFAKTPVLDFDYIGDCELQIEMKRYSEDQTGAFSPTTNNPQILIKNAVTSSNQFRGIKIILGTALGTSEEHGMSAVSVNGVNALIPDSNCDIYHVYDLVAENNVYTVAIDDEPVAITQNTNTSPYYGRTGITTSTHPNPPGFFGGFFKSIKFRRI